MRNSMKIRHHHAPARKRRPADEAAAPTGEHIETPAESLASLRQPQISGAERARAALGMQRVVGNAAVGRELGVQRYAVGAAPDASCKTVLGWMNSRNPYVPNWALTKATFSWGGDFAISGTAPDFHLRVSNPQVTMSGPDVDMPEWSPDSAAMQTAWSDMYARLRKHEGEHEKIANKWNKLLTERLTELDIEVKAKSAAAVNQRANALINAKWKSWIGEFKKEMKSIDPHTEPLDCPDEGAQSSAADDAGNGADSADT